MINNTKLTKHELLHFLETYTEPITIQEISNMLNVNYWTVKNAMLRLKTNGLVRCIGTKPSKTVGRNKKIFEITNAGLKKLDYYNNFKCPNELCSCRKN